MNTITIELCAEDRARLDKILEALTGANKVEAKPEHPVITPFPEAPVVAEPVAEPEQPQEEKPVIVEMPVTVAEVQQKVVALSAAGKKTEVRTIVKAYADKVSAIPEDKLAEVWMKLSELEG